MRLALAAALTTLVVAVLPAQAEIRAGELRCNVAGGIGFGPVGKRATTCVYYRRDGRVEFYLGSFGKYGLDLGPAQARRAIFEVLTNGPEPVGALDGDFAGIGVGATLGRGVAGDALIGGRSGAVQIVPIANSRLAGLNFEAVVSALHLRYAGTEGRRERYRGDLPEGLD